MKNAELAAMVEAANIDILNYRIEYNDDMEGLSEIDWLKREVEWIIEDYTDKDYGHSLYEDLKYARWLLKKTDNGRVIPINVENGFRPLPGFEKDDIEDARQVIAEYKAMRAFQKKLSKIKKVLA